MPPTADAADAAIAAPLTDVEIAALALALEEAPPPLEPLDASALDGYLCGVLLQPSPVPEAQWLPWAGDVEGRPWPAGPAWQRVAAAMRRRHAELDRTIAARQWFDPWLFEAEDEEGDPLPPVALMQPWVEGFSLALEHFPGLEALRDPAAREPMAVLYAAFDPEDLEDADDLLEIIETLEPPSTLAEAAEDLVRSVLRLADVSRPRPAPRPALSRRGRTPGGPRRRA